MTFSIMPFALSVIYAERRYAECRYTECRGSAHIPWLSMFIRMLGLQYNNLSFHEVE